MRYICTAVVATLILAGTSFAATINVPGDQPTIAAAISASSNGDTIAIAAGTYNEHSLNTGGKAITIGSASGNLDVTIDANGGGSVFMLESGEGSGTVIQDLVITGGDAQQGAGSSPGKSTTPPSATARSRATRPPTTAAGSSSAAAARSLFPIHPCAGTIQIRSLEITPMAVVIRSRRIAQTPSTYRMTMAPLRRRSAHRMMVM